MARTILEIATEACERDASAPAPSTLFGTNNRTSRILRLAIKDTMREYLRTSGWQGLSEFYSTWVFTLQPKQFAYTLPPDFLRAIPRTEQRNGWPMGLIGPASPEAWSAWIFGGSAVASPMGWRIRNNTINFEPTPDAAELVTIEYISKYPVVSRIQAGDLDTTSQIPIVNVPVVSRDGYISITDAKLLQLANDQTANFGSQPGFDIGVYADEVFETLKRLDPTSNLDPYPMVRRPEFTADTDLPAFEDDYPLSLGMTFRLRRALGLPYYEHAAEYEEELEIKASTDAGGPRSFKAGSDGRVADVLPLGNGKWMVS